jgi:hypothetical protein
MNSFVDGDSVFIDTLEHFSEGTLRASRRSPATADEIIRHVGFLDDAGRLD